MVQLSHPYRTTGKIIALTIWTFDSKVMSLLFNILFKFAIAFLPRSKPLLISWLQSASAVILEPKKTKYLTVSIVSPSNCHEVVGTDAMILALWMFSFKPAFSLSSFTFIKDENEKIFIKRLLAPFFFHLKGGVIYICEAIDTSPDDLDSSQCFIQPCIPRDFIAQFHCWSGHVIKGILYIHSHHNNSGNAFPCIFPESHTANIIQTPTKWVLM